MNKNKTTKPKKPVEGQIDFTRNMGPYKIIHKWVDSQIKEIGLILMKKAVNHDDISIGDTKTAYRLVKKFGIKKFEKRTKDSNVCSIGFNPHRKKWFGWSHRAICGYTGRNAKQRAKRFAKSVS